MQKVTFSGSAFLVFTRIERGILILLAGIAFLFGTPSYGQNFTGGFNFYMPPNDTIPSVNLPFFPNNVIQDAVYVTQNDEGNFVYDNSRLRFFGVNITTDAAFCANTDARNLAGRLQKLGVNLVRLHHLDNCWTTSIFDWTQSTVTFNLEHLDRLEYLISQLKQSSVFIDMNLHVSRCWKESDGVADGDSIPDLGKGVTLFDPQLIAMQKDYARRLLLHVNPYTGLRLVDDPVMALLEITNENSLYRMWMNDQLNPFPYGLLIARHNAMLNGMWNDYLFDKYGTTDNLIAAWNAGTSVGTNTLINGGFEAEPFSTSWVLEEHGTAQAVATADHSIKYEGNTAAKITVTRTDGTDWHIQWQQSNLSMKKDSLYTLSFAIKGEVPRTMTLTLQQTSGAWSVFLWRGVPVTTDWQVYTTTFVSPVTVTNDLKLAFSPGERTGNIWIDAVSFGKAPVTLLQEGESIEGRTMRRINFSTVMNYTRGRMLDLSEFYLDIENKYFDDMHAFLQDTLGVRVPIEATNWSIGLPDFYVQSRLDFVDTHGYWDHPVFPNIMWDANDWLIMNRSMTNATDWEAITGLFAESRKKGKPLTVSEYNHAFPNRYQSEAMLFLPAYASLHNADAIMYFAYNGTDDYTTDKIEGYFDIQRNPVYTALFPSVALAFRNGLISPSNLIFPVSYSSETINSFPEHYSRENGQFYYPRQLALKHRIEVEDYDAAETTDFSQMPSPGISPFIADNGQIVWNQNGLLKVATPKFVGATGFLHNFLNEPIGALTIKNASDFGTFTWVTLTEAPLQQSSKSLLTVVSKAQNSNMGWDGTQTVHSNWGTPPTQNFPISLAFELRVQADSLKVTQLSPTGAYMGIPQMYYPVTAGAFRVLIDQNAEHSLWFSVDAYGTPAAIEEETETEPVNSLAQNSPNPFNAQTTVRFTLAQEGDVDFSIYNVLGERVYFETFFAGAGTHIKQVHLPQVSSGVYIYELKTPFFRAVQKMVIVK